MECVPLFSSTTLFSALQFHVALHLITDMTKARIFDPICEGGREREGKSGKERKKWS